jgi:hypothetical protein
MEPDKMSMHRKWHEPANIFGLCNLDLIEPSYADLPDDRYTSILTTIQGDQGRLLIDENSDPLAAAVHTGNDSWTAGCFHLRIPTASVITWFENLGGDIYQEERDVWEASVRAYYSRQIAGEVTPALEDLNPARIGIIRSLVKEIWGEGNGERCLDFCCGSGLGSVVLRDLGYRLLACDIDMSLLSLGFLTGRLFPEETMCIDATCADAYIRKSPLGLGLMFGEINQFNVDLWEQITLQLLSVSRRSIVTTGTEDEAARIAGWAADAGAVTKIMENDRDPIYDRWVCVLSEPCK